MGSKESKKAEDKAEAKQVVEPKEASKNEATEVKTQHDVEINKPEDNKEIKGEDVVSADTKMAEGGVIDNTDLKSPQDYQHEKDFKSITDLGTKEIIVDKERLQLVPHELTGEPVFETAEEYQKYLASK